MQEHNQEIILNLLILYMAIMAVRTSIWYVKNCEATSIIAIVLFLFEVGIIVVMLLQ